MSYNDYRPRTSTYIDQYGYERFSNSGKSVARWIAGNKLGRELKPWEVVHHKDRNKANNHPDNLWVCRSQYEHDQIHRYDAQRYGYGYSYRGSRRYYRNDYYN